MIYQLFLTRLHETPHAVAISTLRETLTYEEVSFRVNAWANYFIKQGIEQGDLVGVLLENEEHHLFILLALDRINACYVPFDTDIPKRQLAADITTLNLKKFFIESSLCDTFSIPPELQIGLSSADFHGLYADTGSPDRVYERNSSKNTYAVSTSGSTGEKKWMLIQGGGILYWGEVIKTLCKFTSEDKILATRSPAYDARIFEYVCAFSTGMQLYLLNRKEERKDLMHILHTCKTAQISCLLLIASQLGIENSERIIDTLKQAGLEHLMVTGDACTLLLKSLCERSRIKLWNCYGPTEATFGLSILCMNGLHLFNSSGQEIIPIGKPEGEEVRYQIIGGVLHIQSPYLTLGYLRHEDEKAFKRITEGEKSIRLFNTGDICDEQDGFIIYQGRASFDSHCKINGIKVTPFFIEQRILDYNKECTDSPISAVAVVIKEFLGKNKPFAYLVLPEHFDKRAFVSYLSESVKKEEFPILIEIASLPRLLPSEKIDRQFLISLQDDSESFFFDAGKSERVKFNNEGKGPDVEELAHVIASLEDDRHLQSLTPQDFAALINKAVLCSNHIDQQQYTPLLDQKEREVKVFALLKSAYSKLVLCNPCLDFLSQPHQDLALIFALPQPILSAAAQLLHYFGKALRYDDTSKLESRMVIFNASIAIATFLEEHIPERERTLNDPNYFPARLLTYRLPIIYSLKQQGEVKKAIEAGQEQLKLAKDICNVFHVIQALVQLSESYLLDEQLELAFENAQSAFDLTNKPESKHTILYFNALTALMACADKKGDKVLAQQLAKSVIALEGTEGIALKMHHIRAAKKVLQVYYLTVEKIWRELFQRDNLPIHAEFTWLGGDSVMMLTMVSKINQELDSKFSFLTLLSLPKITIDSVANSLIMKKEVCSEQAIIQTLTRGGEEKKNIFFLPPLLGEGYFTYRHLARRIAGKLDKNIYALSDPGISDEELLPVSMEHAVNRYIKAIKSVQPTGPYELLGFSFGATLAYEVARTLHVNGEKISELHLHDGFPPLLYQVLPDKVYVRLLQALINFMVVTLNNHFYAEKIKTIVLRGFETLDKVQQVNLAFEYLIKRVTNPASKHLLHIAKRHLTFVLEAKEPSQKLPIWPVLYLTNTEQQYLKIVQEIPFSSAHSADINYFFWTRYLFNLTRCGLELKGDHLSVLKSSAPEYEITPECFYARSHDELFNLKLDHYGPRHYYSLEPLPNGEHKWSIFFLNRSSAMGFAQTLQTMGFKPRVIFHDKSFKKYERGDTIYTSQASFFARVPATKVEQITSYMSKEHFKKVDPPAKPSQPVEAAPSRTEPKSMDLVVIWNRSILLTLSFKYHSIQKELMRALYQRLELLPIDFSEETDGFLTYQHRFINVGCSVYEAIKDVVQFLTIFISVVQPYTDEAICDTEPTRHEPSMPGV